MADTTHTAIKYNVTPRWPSIPIDDHLIVPLSTPRDMEPCLQRRCDLYMLGGGAGGLDVSLDGDMGPKYPAAGWDGNGLSALGGAQGGRDSTWEGLIRGVGPTIVLPPDWDADSPGLTSTGGPLLL